MYFNVQGHIFNRKKKTTQHYESIKEWDFGRELWLAVTKVCVAWGAVNTGVPQALVHGAVSATQQRGQNLGNSQQSSSTSSRPAWRACSF